MVSKTFVWIRHAEKKFKNGKGCLWDKQHDPGIIEDEENIYETVNKLADEYGIPDKILTSPFLRTRQTSDVMKKILLQKYDKNIEISICNNVREYLGFCKSKDGYADLDYQTEKHIGGPVKLKESTLNLTLRLESHINNLNKHEKNVWIITHGILMSNIYKLHTGDEPDRPKPLDYIIYDNNQISKNF
jgi:broad specificity phosphatase PhoE